MLENLCRRMRAMVVRTAIVVHMVLPPGTSCLWERWWFRALRLLPLKGLNGKRQRLWCNSLDYSCLPSWLLLMIGEISRGLARIKEGGWISLEGLGGKQSMLFVSILNTIHLTAVPSTQQATSTSILSFIVKKRAQFCKRAC